MAERNLKTILINLLEKNHLLSVGDILAKLEESGKTFNKTSVYRALDQLLEEKQVCKHYFAEAQAFYELRDHHHTHLTCSNCGTVEKTACTYEQPKKVGEFLVDHHHLTLVGLCKKCRLA